MNRSHLFPMVAVCLLAACNATVEAGRDVLDGGDASSSRPVDATSSRGDADAAFVCSPPAGATSDGISFTGTKFDPAAGCLTGSPIALPICGCFHGTGKDSSTWCFADPDGTAYFGISNDQCDIEVPAGWYAQQTFGPSPGLTPNAAQKEACATLVADSTARGSYDMPGPPGCGADDASAVDAGAGDATLANGCPADGQGATLLGGPCVTTADCNGDTMYTLCEYDPAQGCTAKGQCITLCGPVPGGATVVSGCACDGSEVVDLPFELNGYSTQPLRGTPVGSMCPPDGGASPEGGFG